MHPCVVKALRIADQGDVPAALKAIDACPTKTAAVAATKAKLLYRANRPAYEAWADAYGLAKTEARDPALIARSGWAYAQLALDAGDIAQARAVSDDLQARQSDFSKANREGHAYLRALITQAEGDFEAASRRFGVLSRSSDASLARAARVARANLWGQTGRSMRALAELREVVRAPVETDDLRAELLHSTAWNGVLAIEAQKGRIGAVEDALLNEVRGYYAQLARL
ncbi:MAG: hypothetical protein AAFV29_23385, partial [Myxococcota bacterium]